MVCSPPLRGLGRPASTAHTKCGGRREGTDNLQCLHTPAWLRGCGTRKSLTRQMVAVSRNKCRATNSTLLISSSSRTYSWSLCAHAN